MLKSLLPRLLRSESLDRAEASAAMESIMTGEASPAQIAAFLVAMRMKGETAEEIAGLAQVMRRHATPIAAGPGTVDTCGTGGDESGTFNISTAAALIAAGAGARVAKHGNRSVSSLSGSADVLAALGVNIDASPEVIARCIAEAGVGFLFAPGLHKAMRHAVGPRREIGVRTVFNLLGPLTNPAGSRRQLMGVYDSALCPLVADVLARLGAERALVVAGADGLDELTTTAETRVCRVEGGQVFDESFDASALGLPRARLADLRVSGPEESADAIRAILGGAEGPRADISALNAAGAIIAAGIEDDWLAALRLARESVSSGRAARALAALVETSNREA